MKALKDVLKTATIAIALFWPPAYFYIDQTLSKSSTQKKEQQFREISFSVEHTKSLLAQGLSFEACTYLSQRYEQKMISLFVLEAQDTQCMKPEGLNTQQLPLKSKNNIHTTTLNQQKLHYASYQVGEAQMLVGAFEPQITTFMSLLLSGNKEFLIPLLLDTALILWLAFAFWFIWVLRNLKRIQGLYLERSQPFWFKLVDWVSRRFDLSTSEQIFKMQKSAVDQLKKIEAQRSYYSDSLEYTLLNEISGDKNEIQFPFSFDGVVARIDINNYSALIYEGNRNHLLELKRRFDWLAAECAYRYGGLFEGRAGDEVVYVFRDENKELRAAAFIRDFMSEFSEIKFEFYNQTQIRLFTKASLASSKIVMEASPSKFDFDGDALYLTNRMFGELPYKDRNILIVFPELVAKIRPLVAEPFESRTVQNKEATLYVSYVDQFKPYEECGSQIGDLGRYFLGDQGLKNHLIYLTTAERPLIQRLELAKSILNHIRTKKISQNVVELWLSRMSALQQEKDLSDTGSEMLINLESLYVSLGAHLVSKDIWNPQLSTELINQTASMAPRSQANAIEVLVSWGDHLLALELGTKIAMANPYNFRLKANLFVAEGVLKLSDDLLAKVLSMMRSESNIERASGSYAAVQIVSHYQSCNPGTLLSCENYSKVMSELNNKSSALSPRLAELYKKVQIDAH